MVGVLWVHAGGLCALAALDGFTLVHDAGVGALVAAFAIAAGRPQFGRKLRTLAVEVGLVSCSALLVHEWDATEAHFHFFVSVMALTLYKDWFALSAALGFLGVHHAVLGVSDPQGLYGHDGEPWLWAGVHTAFTIAAAAGVIATWGAQRARAPSRGRHREGAARKRAAPARRADDAASRGGDRARRRGQADARASICAAVVELTGADFATVMEPAGDRLS